jgi:hypothetical protein
MTKLILLSALLLIALAPDARFHRSLSNTIKIRGALIIKPPPGFPDDIARRDPIEAATGYSRILSGMTFCCTGQWMRV